MSCGGRLSLFCSLKGFLKDGVFNMSNKRNVDFQGQRLDTKYDGGTVKHKSPNL